MAGKHGIQKLDGGMASKQEVMSSETEGEELGSGEEWKKFGVVIVESQRVS